jgi:hypothetical protein
MRTEFAAVEAGFALLPTISGNANKLVAINAGATALTVTTTPVLGTPTSGTLTNCTGLPLTTGVTGTLAVTNGGTGRATSTTAYGLLAAGTTATGVQQTLAAGATTEILVGGGAAALPVWTTATGSGAPVRATSPTLVTPVLGAATATSINGLTVTSSTGTLTITNGKSLSVSNTITLSGTDSTVMTFPSTTATIARTDAAQSFTGTQTFGGVLLSGDGAIGAPTYSFTTDPDCGLYRVSANFIRLAVGGINGVGIDHNGGSPIVSVNTVSASGIITAQGSSVTTAGGLTGLQMGSASMAITWGSGAPTMTATKGSLYLRTDGSATNNRAYINTDGATTWTALTTAA